METKIQLILTLVTPRCAPKEGDTSFLKKICTKAVYRQPWPCGSPQKQSSSELTSWCSCSHVLRSHVPCGKTMSFPGTSRKPWVGTGSDTHQLGDQQPQCSASSLSGICLGPQLSLLNPFPKPWVLRTGRLCLPQLLG